MTSTATAPFWRLDVPEIAEGGTIARGGMFTHQREWWELPNFIRGLVTGYGGGKTMALGKRMIWLALKNAPVPVVTVSPSYPMALTTIVQTIDELLAGKCRNEPELRYNLFRSQPYRFDIRLGHRRATILCMSGERPERLKGSNIAAAGIDEPFIQPVEVFQQILARVRHPDARQREINITGTPEGVVGWGYDLFQGDMRDKHDLGLVQCASTENLALPAGYLERLVNSYDEAAAEAYVHGKFVNLSTGRVYHSYDPDIHTVDVEKPAEAELCVGMDFNVNPLAFVVFWRTQSRLHIVGEHELPNCDAEQAAQFIRDKYPTVRRIYPDASGQNRQHAGAGGKSAHGYLRDAGFTICARRANPQIVDRINACNGALRHGRVTIAPSCRKMRAYLLGYTHTDSNKQVQKDMSHLLDAFGYPVSNLFPVDRNAATTVAFRQ